MEPVILNVALQHPFGNLYRDRHVLLLVQDTEGLILTGMKPKFYPEGITRLLGGGIDKGEEPLDAAVRELLEETGVLVNKSDLKPVAEVIVNAKTPERTFTLTTFIYHIVLDQELIPGDDITEIKQLSLQELFHLADAYEALADDFWFISEDGKKEHIWGDYGKVYGPIHRLAATYLTAA